MSRDFIARGIEMVGDIESVCRRLPTVNRNGTVS